VRVGLLLTLGEAALVGVLFKLLACSEVSFLSTALRMMLDQLLPGAKAPFMLVGGVVRAGDAFGFLT
jgi:hypothetical protein